MLDEIVLLRASQLFAMTEYNTA